MREGWIERVLVFFCVFVCERERVGGDCVSVYKRERMRDREYDGYK